MVSLGFHFILYIVAFNWFVPDICGVGWGRKGPLPVLVSLLRCSANLCDIVSHYSTTIQNCVYFDRLQSSGWNPMQGAPVLRACFSTRNKLFKQLRMQHTRTVYNNRDLARNEQAVLHQQVLQACAANDIQHAINILLHLAPSRGIIPSVKSFTVSLNACLQNPFREFDVAHELLNTMRKLGLEMDTVFW
jgi:hypothetical protein